MFMPITLSAFGALRVKTNCIMVMGKESSVDVVSMRVEDGDKIKIDGIFLDVIYTSDIPMIHIVFTPPAWSSPETPCLLEVQAEQIFCMVVPLKLTIHCSKKY